MKRFMRELVALGWSVVGAGFVLMTVTGSVFKTGVLLTALGVAIQLSGLLIPEDENEEQTD
jgi:hypothetical protein